MSIRVRIFWVAVVIIGSIVLTALLASGAPAQELTYGHGRADETAPKAVLVIPPTIRANNVPSCTVAQHSVAESLDTQDGTVKTVYRFRAEPLLLKGAKIVWHLPTETMASSHTTRNGALVDAWSISAAAETCSKWIAAVREAARKGKP